MVDFSTILALRNENSTIIPNAIAAFGKIANPKSLALLSQQPLEIDYHTVAINTHNSLQKGFGDYLTRIVPVLIMTNESGNNNFG